MSFWLALFLGISCAAAGGELFVRGVVGVAAWLRVPTGVVAATLAAFATSAPELAVAVNSALAGAPEISFGDALGSNVVNISLVFGLVLLVGPLRISRDELRRDYLLALATPAVTALLIADGRLSRFDGIVLMLGFAFWFGAVTLSALKERVRVQFLAAPGGWRVVAATSAGLLLLVLAGRLIVVGGHGLGQAYGISEFVIGASLVAVGTSIPELATALISRWRGHDEIGVGTVIGSNIFNGLFVAPLAAVIAPADIDRASLLLTLTVGVIGLLLLYPGRGKELGRNRGAILLSAYCIYALALAA